MISHKDIEHLKDLARVEFDAEETDNLAKDLDSILNYVATLSEANIDNVPEMTRAFEMTNVVRKDEDVASSDKEYSDEARAIIDSFPEKEESYLKVNAIF